jgi:hypothetical protein
MPTFCSSASKTKNLTGNESLFLLGNDFCDVVHRNHVSIQTQNVLDSQPEYLSFFLSLTANTLEHV